MITCYRKRLPLRPGRAALLLLPLLGLVLASCAHREPASSLQLYQEGLSLEREQKPWEAIVRYREALRDDGGNNEIRLHLSDLLMATGDYGSAERNYKVILKDDPGNTAVINNLSWLNTITGHDLAWSVEVMTPLAAKPSPHRHIYLDTLGTVHLKRREYQQAAAAFQEASDLCRKGVVMSTSDECDRINEHLKTARERM